MPTSDPLEVLLKTDRWGMRGVLDACDNLTDAQLDQPFEMGVGSLRATLTHILGALRGWGDMLAGREQRERLEEGGPYSVAQLKELHDEIASDFERSARSHPTDEIVSGERGGHTYSFPRGGVVTHVTTHGFHHRAQCLNMLRQLGVEPLPRLGIAWWMLEVDSKA